MQYIENILSICKNIYDRNSATNYEKKMLKEYPHMFVFGCVMDSQINSDKAWKIPYLISKEIGGFEFKLFASHDEEYYVKLFNKNKYHRFNDVMAKALYNSIKIIETKYSGHAENIWNDNPSSSEIVYRFLEFDRVGVKIATMAANILSRDYGIPVKDHYAIDISPDIHVKRAMYRLGLIEEIPNDDFSNIDSTKIIYRAKSIYPEFPGIMDLAFWQIGKDKICTNTECHADICPFGKICKRQGICKK